MKYLVLFVNTLGRLRSAFPLHDSAAFDWCKGASLFMCASCCLLTCGSSRVAIWQLPGQ